MERINFHLNKFKELEIEVDNTKVVVDVSDKSSGIDKEILLKNIDLLELLFNEYSSSMDNYIEVFERLPITNILHCLTYDKRLKTVKRLLNNLEIDIEDLKD